MTDIWNMEEPINTYPGLEDIEIPRWIEQDISPQDVASIVQGGCASGAYMPAVTYHQAIATMSEHGDDVLQYIQDAMGELPKPNDDVSWSGMACFYLSYAVELWACSNEPEIERLAEENESDAA